MFKQVLKTFNFERFSKFQRVIVLLADSKYCEFWSIAIAVTADFEPFHLLLIRYKLIIKELFKNKAFYFLSFESTIDHSIMWPSSEHEYKESR
jgi:hypothetical protein